MQARKAHHALLLHPDRPAVPDLNRRDGTVPRAQAASDARVRHGEIPRAAGALIVRIVDPDGEPQPLRAQVLGDKAPAR